MFKAKAEHINARGYITGETELVAIHPTGTNVVLLFIGRNHISMSWDTFSEMAAIVGVKHTLRDGRKLVF